MNENFIAFDEASLMASTRLAHTFYTRGTLWEIPKRTIIFLAGTDPDHVFLVASGLVKVGASTASGRDITFFLQKPGNIFGFSEILLHQQRRRQAEAIKPSRLWALPRSVFKHLIDTDPSSVKALLCTVSLRLLKTQEMVEALVDHSVAWRLGHFLLQCSEAAITGHSTVSLHVSHAEISQIIGASRQSVTEQLNRWASMGVIQFRGKTLIIVQPDALKAEP